MATLRKTRPITVEEYLEGEKASDTRHEFVGGEVHAMVGASQAHNLIVVNTVAALYNHLRGTGCRVFTGTMKLRIGSDFYYPDLLVVCDRADVEAYYLTRPTLIVEVLSPATVMRDTREKLVAYQGIESLREYVLAEQDRREVRVYRRAGTTWDLAVFAGTAKVELASVELSLSLDEIYGDVLP
jgi:Uma2 family endonuclease